MMRVSICIGVAHVSLANAIAARRARSRAQTVVHFGWIVAACGGLVLWLVPGPWGGVALTAGLAAVVVGQGAARPVETPRDWLWRIAAGVQGLTRVSSMFGDVLSYMRLFALGLASASLAATFNGLATDLAGGVPGAGVALAIVVAALGHGINLALGIVSGAVHGLRLNFIEFFGWGLTEEGYPFRAFERREIAP
jgi:V/A-type H+-transporting ATPase subunit I